MSVSDQDDAVLSRVQSAGKGSQELPRVERELVGEEISDARECSPVHRRTAHYDEQSTVSCRAVAPLDVRSTQLRLGIYETRYHLAIDPHAGSRIPKHEVEGAQVSWYRYRNLDRHSPDAPDALEEPPGHRELADVSERRSDGKGARRQSYTQDRCVELEVSQADASTPALFDSSCFLAGPAQAPTRLRLTDTGRYPCAATLLADLAE